jgi:hypothetical protein
MKSPAPILFAAFKASSDTCTRSNNQVWSSKALQAKNLNS